MAALIHAKTVGGRKVWYVWGHHDGKKWVREYPQSRSRSDFYEALEAELALPSTTDPTDIVFTLMHKTWMGDRWVDDFVVQLRAFRERAGLTQAALAEKAGLSPQAIAALEQETRAPTWDTVRRLAHALGVGVEEFNLDLPEEQPTG